jgi:hypothetical protein
MADMRGRRLPPVRMNPILVLVKKRRTEMGLIQNLKKALRPRTAAEIEAEYLNGATSTVDLEMRMRDRGRFRRSTRGNW